MYRKIFQLLYILYKIIFFQLLSLDTDLAIETHISLKMQKN